MKTTALPSAQEQHTLSRKRFFLFTLACCAFFVGMDVFIVVALIPSMMLDVHTSPHIGGLLVTAYALCYALSAPLFGPVGDRWGRKPVILLGLVVFGVGTLLTGMATSFPFLLALRALPGLGGAIIMPSVFALVGDTFPYAQRGRAMGIIMGATVSATIIGVPLGSVLASLGSWRWTFWVVGMAAFALIALVVKVIAHTALKQEHTLSAWATYLSRFRMALTTPDVRFALLATFLWTAGLQGMFANIGVYYQQNFHLNTTEIGFILMTAGGASVGGNVIGGHLSDRIGKKVIVTWAAIGAAGGVFGFSLLTHTLVAALLVHLLWSTSIGCGQSSLTALVSELSPHRRGTVLALNSSALYLGMMVATAIAAMLLTTISTLSLSFAAIGLLCAGATLLVLPIIGSVQEMKRDKQAPPHLSNSSQ